MCCICGCLWPEIRRWNLGLDTDDKNIYKGQTYTQIPQWTTNTTCLTQKICKAKLVNIHKVLKEALWVKNYFWAQWKSTYTKINLRKVIFFLWISLWEFYSLISEFFSSCNSIHHNTRLCFSNLYFNVKKLSKFRLMDFDLLAHGLRKLCGWKCDHYFFPSQREW